MSPPARTRPLVPGSSARRFTELNCITTHYQVPPAPPGGLRAGTRRVWAPGLLPATAPAIVCRRNGLVWDSADSSPVVGHSREVQLLPLKPRAPFSDSLANPSRFTRLRPTVASSGELRRSSPCASPAASHAPHGASPGSQPRRGQAPTPRAGAQRAGNFQGREEGGLAPASEWAAAGQIFRDHRVGVTMFKPRLSTQFHRLAETNHQRQEEG